MLLKFLQVQLRAKHCGIILLVLYKTIFMQHDTNKESGLERKDDTMPNTTEKQEKSDPQLTELRGFVDPNEDLEPTLQDGTKSPEKAQEEYKENKH